MTEYPDDFDRWPEDDRDSWAEAAREYHQERERSARTRAKPPIGETSPEFSEIGGTEI